jgi:hypothetical protein
MLKIGDTFKSDGYDVVAVFTTYLGEIRYEVLNNNSSHYLVVAREPASMDRWHDTSAEWEPKVRLLASYQYWGRPEEGPTAFTAYMAAYCQAFLYAKHVSEDSLLSGISVRQIRSRG